MEKPRELLEKEVEQSPVFQELLQRAKVNGQSLISYHGILFAITPLEDITSTFTPEEAREFASDFAAADDPANHLTVDQAVARHKQRSQRHG